MHGLGLLAHPASQPSGQAAADPDDLAATLGRGRALMAAGDLRGGVAAIEQAVARAPSHPLCLAVYREVGLALHARMMWVDALPWLSQAAAIEPWDETLTQLVERIAPDPTTVPAIHDPVQGRTLSRYRAYEAPTYQYTIDIVGTCNLRCPTCPVGNSALDDRPRGLMPHVLFERIVAKIAGECPSKRPQVALFNWGEPLLHPELPRFIATLRAHGMASHLSTNLNVKRGLEAMVAANPDDLKISLSGWHQGTYGRTHARGDIALVKANLRLLREHMDTHRATTNVWVSHHLYRSNLHEQDEVRAACADLGFVYNPIAAFYMPLERLQGLLHGQANPQDGGIVADLLIAPHERAAQVAAVRSGRYDCELRFNQTTINHDGSVALCCSVYDRANMLGLDFLDHDHAAIEARKYAHPFCAACFADKMDYSQAELRPNGPGDAG